MPDALTTHIVQMQGSTPWGRLLDAGTGRHSLAWISSLETLGWTAVTHREETAQELTERPAGPVRAEDRLVTGTWADPSVLAGESFDTILCDYLLGALNDHAPHFQQKIFKRLRPHARGRMYVVGLDPWPDDAEDPAARLLLDVLRARDACFALGGRRIYREYDMEWTVDRLRKSGFEVTDARRFPNVFRRRFVETQISTALEQLDCLPDTELAQHMAAHLERLRERAAAQITTGVRLGSDYVICADVASDPEHGGGRQ